jgi:MFS family permease
MIHFLKKKHHFSKISKLSFIVLLITLSLSLIDTIWAIYLYQFVPNDSFVGLTSALFTIISLMGFVFLIPFIERFDKVKLFELTLFLTSICYIIFAISSNFWMILLLGLILALIAVIRIDCFGIIVNDASKREELAKNEGIIYTIANFGWLVGPLIAAPLSEKFNISLIFILSAFFILFAFVSYKFLHIGVRKRISKKTDGNFWKNLQTFFKDKDLLKNYIISGNGSIWWSFTFIYIPLYMFEKGFSISHIGYFLFIIILPLILFEYWFTNLADKIKYQKIFILGNILPAVVLVLCFFISNVYLQLILVALGSIGIAMTESSSEAYFFLVAPKKHLEKYYSVYNTALDVFAFIGKVFIAIILLIFAFKFAFLFLALIFLIFALVASRIKEISGAKLKNKH